MGEPQTGKTAMSSQLCSDGSNFPKNYLMTHCMSVLVKSINIPDTNDCVELYLTDCSGREVYLDMLHDCWKGTTLLVAMYDVCNDQSFGAVAKVRMKKNVLKSTQIFELVITQPLTCFSFFPAKQGTEVSCEIRCVLVSSPFFFSFLWLSFARRPFFHLFESKPSQKSIELDSYPASLASLCCFLWL